MNLYKLSPKLTIVESGPVDYDGAIAELEKSTANSYKIYQYGEDAVSETMFGLSKTDQDFIEISVTEGIVNIHTDLLERRSLLDVLKRKSLDRTIGSKEIVLEVIDKYFKLDRKRFEAYLKSL